MLLWPSLGPWTLPWHGPVIPVPWPADTLWAEVVLSQTSLAIEGIGATRSSSVHSSSPHGLYAWDYLECCWGCYPTLLLSGQPSAWLFGFPAQMSPSTGFMVTADLACTFSQSLFIFTLCFVGSNHKLSVCSIRAVIEVAYWAPYMFSYHMKWDAVLKVLLHLLIHDPSMGPCNLIWFRVLSSLVAKEGTFSWLLCVTL